MERRVARLLACIGCRGAWASLVVNMPFHADGDFDWQKFSVKKLYPGRKLLNYGWGLKNSHRS